MPSRLQSRTSYWILRGAFRAAPLYTRARLVAHSDSLCSLIYSFNAYLNLGVSDKDATFISSLLEKTCMYDNQWIPKSMQKCAFLKNESFSNFTLDYNDAQEEAEIICGRALEDLFRRSGIQPGQVDVVVSMSTQMTRVQDALIRQFDFRDDVEILTLGGMGCAASVTAMDFASKYLSQRSTPTTMIALCHENLIRGFYTGLARESMISNALFRAGASCMMFSTDPSLTKQAKFRMEFTTRTYQTDDTSFWLMGYKLDETGAGGIFLPKKEFLGEVSARAIGSTMSRVGRKILPAWDKVKYLLSRGKAKPDFFKSIDHICVHPGGPAVIDKMGKALGCDAAVRCANSINAYYYYGNTSSAGVIYSMTYTESLEGVKKGQRLLACGLGAGFESNAAVLVAMRDLNEVHKAWEPVAKDASMQPLAVEAFVDGFRGRKRMRVLDTSNEMKARTLLEFSNKCGIDCYTSTPQRGLSTFFTKLPAGLARESPVSVADSEGSISTETSSESKAQARVGLVTPPKTFEQVRSYAAS
jgi:3-ketoacyl-CoA synthase